MEKNKILQEIERLNSDLFYGCSHIKDNGKMDLFPEIENKPESTFSFEVNYSLLKRELDKLDTDTRYAVVKEIVDESSVYEYLKIYNGDSEEEIARYKDYIKMLRYEYLGSYEGNDQKQTFESVDIPKELDTPKARKIFEKAIETGFIEKTVTGYKWNGQKNLLAYFADLMNEYMHLGKGEYDGKQKRDWKSFETLFGITDLAGAERDYKRNGTTPARSDEIELLFKE